MCLPLGFCCRGTTERTYPGTSHLRPLLPCLENVEKWNGTRTAECKHALVLSGQAPGLTADRKTQKDDFGWKAWKANVTAQKGQRPSTEAEDEGLGGAGSPSKRKNSSPSGPEGHASRTWPWMEAPYPLPGSARQGVQQHGVGAGVEGRGHCALCRVTAHDGHTGSQPPEFPGSLSMG